MPVEWDIRASDTHLVAPIDAAATTILLAHKRGAAANDGIPVPIWLTIAPDDPGEREDVLVTALALNSASATVVRGIGYSAGIPHRAGTPVRLGTRAGAFPINPIAPSFQNSWANIGGAWESAKYWISPDMLVHVVAAIDTGAVNTACFTLPAGFRPSGARNFPGVAGGGTFGYVEVTNGGVFTPRLIGTGAIYFNVLYYAEL